MTRKWNNNSKTHATASNIAQAGNKCELLAAGKIMKCGIAYIAGTQA